MNNADLAVQAMRKTQEFVFDKYASPHSIYEKMDQDIVRVNKASKQINIYEEQLNRIINVLDKKGLFNSDVIAAFTGLDVEKAKKLEGKLEEVKEAILK